MFLKKQIPVLLEQGVITKSSSPWRHAPVIIPKRSGGHRIAINYKPVNSVTIADAFPLPRVDEMLEQLSGSQVFSSLDFTQFYYQLPLTEEDQPKTAFFALNELYEFKRCPFGLKNAVSYCTRIMSELFAGVEGVLIYLDDILVFGKTRAEHDLRLSKVLTIIQDNNLSLNMSKCTFSKTQVTYLGHHIKDGNIKPDPERIDAILKFKVPRSIRELDQFLGMCNYFRNFLPDYASLSKCLYEMKKTDNFTWKDTNIKNFHKIKGLLAESILLIPDPKEQLILWTDASDDWIGGCLCNLKGQAVSFVSRKLTDVETRWSTLDS